MKGSDGIKGWDALVIDLNGLAARKCCHLSTPAEAIEIQLRCTTFPKELRKVDDSGQDVLGVRCCLEECLYGSLWVPTSIQGGFVCGDTSCTLSASFLGG
jgi:hypothetical protein